MGALAESIAAYETWLRGELGPDFVEEDLEKKHHKMRKSAFGFLRATYWRWAETIFDICPALAGAPALLAIGDTHLENFGSWRDAEGRLVWGVNDLDEATMMPYVLDIVRLANSALLAEGDDGPVAADICEAILTGYRQGLTNPCPVVLERDHKWLRQLVRLPESDRAEFWEKFESLTPAEPSPRFVEALRRAMPDPDVPMVIAPRTAGTGSLGRPRFVARADWRGGPALRESKAIVPSAWCLAHAPGDRQIRVQQLAAGRFRAPDPYYQVSDGVLVRRLSPNSRKIEVKHSSAELLSDQMLEMMGFDIANCHADDEERRQAVLRDLTSQPDDWLLKAATAAADAMAKEQKEFASS